MAASQFLHNKTNDSKRTMNQQAQQIPKGYKQTEVGLIPKDWNVQEIGEIADVDTENLSTNTPLSYKFSYISLEDVKKGKLLNSTVMLFRNAPSRARRIVRKGDTLFGTVRPNLQSHIFISNKVNDTICSTGFAVIRSKNKKLNTEFIYHHLYGNLITNQITNILVGSNYPAVNSKDVKRLLVIVPTNPKEQALIAQILTETDELIENLEKLIAKKKAIRQGAMQELLTGKKRLPGFPKDKNVSKQSELGIIPEDWNVQPLPKVASIINGKAHEKFVTENRGKYIVVNSKFISTEGAVVKYCSKNFSPAMKGDVLMVLSDLPNGKALAKCFFAEKHNIYAINQRVCAYRTRTMDPKFLYYFLNRNKYFLKFDDGVSQTHILSNMINKCPVLIPSSRLEQSAIAETISSMDKEINVLKMKLEKNRRIKTGMMQQLLTGKVRLVC